MQAFYRNAVMMAGISAMVLTGAPIPAHGQQPTGTGHLSAPIAPPVVETTASPPSANDDQADQNTIEDKIFSGETWPKVSVSADGKTIYLVGDLNNGAYIRFARLLRASPDVERVHLSSKGGLILEGRMIGALIRKRGLSTYVEYVCASSCTLAFIAGQERTIAPHARLGFHQSYYTDEDGGIAEKEADKYDYTMPESSSFPQVVGLGGDRVFSLYFGRAGVESDFTAKAISTPPSEIWYPEADLLKSSKFVTRAVDATEIAPVPAWDIPRDKIATDLLSRPLWARYKEIDPAGFEKTVDDVWLYANSGSDLETAEAEGRTTILNMVDEKLKFAPDELLDRFIVLRGEIARYERATNYPTCRAALTDRVLPLSEEGKKLYEREDALAVETLSSTLDRKPLSPEKASRQFGKLAGDILDSGVIDASQLMKDKYSCELGFQMIEGIASLDKKRRVKAYRAMVSL